MLSIETGTKTEFLAETVKNWETWLDHERIASTQWIHAATFSDLEELGTNSLVLGYLLWRNHRFQGARKSVECRFEIRDGPGHRGSLSETTESNQLARHLPIFDFPSVSSPREKIYWVVRASTKKIQSFCYRRGRKKVASVVNWRKKKCDWFARMISRTCNSIFLLVKLFIFIHKSWHVFFFNLILRS